MAAHRVAVLFLAAATTGVILAAPASASCAMPQGKLKARLADVEFAFVGTVIDTHSGGRVAAVNVESVWQGTVQSPATVIGGETGATTMSSVDRSYKVGQRYLFVPYARDDQGYRDNICTDTRPWSNKLLRVRPKSAVDAAAVPAGAARGGAAGQSSAGPSTQNETAPTSGDQRWMPWTIGIGMGLIAAALVARSRRNAGE